MTVQSIINTTPVTISPDATFREGVEILLERRVRSLPVVDAAGTYLGVFDFNDIWKMLLPRAALLDRESIAGLAFVSGSLEQLREKLLEADPRSIRDFLDDKESPAIFPETPVREAVLLMHRRGGSLLPVVDRTTRRFLGILTPWEILDHLR